MTTLEKELAQLHEMTASISKRKHPEIAERTPEEMEKEIWLHEEALKLGINLDMTNAVPEDDEYEVEKTQALVYLMQGKEVPKDLREMLMRVQQEDHSNQRTTTQENPHEFRRTCTAPRAADE
ncbi:MAG: hypothetical protein Q4F29_10215 [Lachnospiraceae bacterium]|nr:hypothetical protein [Lachnospiraceae bacterium]